MGVDHLKTREPRRKVLIAARMRVGARWGDVRILDLSKRGMLVQAAEPPERGTYLEVRRGAQAIVARVVWSAGNRFGAYTQDPLNVDALVQEADAPDCGSPVPSEARPAERRSAFRAPSAGERHERHRWLARAVEFACVASFGFGVAMVLGESLRQALAAPLSVTSAALDRQ